jgi:hypothetical protein
MVWVGCRSDFIEDAGAARPSHRCVQLRGFVGIPSVQEEEEDKRTRQDDDVSWWLQVSFGGPSLLLSYLFLAAC